MVHAIKLKSGCPMSNVKNRGKLAAYFTSPDFNAVFGIGLTLPLPISHLCESYLPLPISHLCEFHMCICINCNGDILLHAWLKIANQNGQ